MRRGLGTSNDDEADQMVAEMNLILSDESWWNASRRLEAELRFRPPVVQAFFDEIQAGREDSEVLREKHIHLPNAEEGYSRVLFVGTTGAGKTSLLRQLIGSDPDEDRFPSTAPAKTTIADIEVIQAEGEFEAAVTFFTEFQTQASIEECVVDAALAVYEKASVDKVAERFLNHRDQKFRLSYLLGSWKRTESDEEQFEMSFDEEDDGGVSDVGDSVSEEDRARNEEILENYLARVTNLAEAVVAYLSEELDLELQTAGPDREAALQLIEESLEAQLVQQEKFHELVQDILDDVRSRFEFVQAGEIIRRPSGWPDLWIFRSDDRNEFIRQIRWFSSNYWPQFGRLLTPLVDGIRLRGPLFSSFIEGQPKLALIDGQGLGHTPDSSASIATRVTRRFGQVDVILLVDNAQQPMQAAPLSVLRAVASSGHHEKLAIAFTHFDQIKGQNLPRFPEKRAHVMASVLGALSALKEVLGSSVVRAIEHGIDSRCFMLGGIDRQLTKLPARAADYVKAQLSGLIHFFESAIEPQTTVRIGPWYDPAGIGFAVQEAVTKFQGPWLARLGKGSYKGFSKEHWTRVKALNRRIAGELDDEYDTLRPVADLVTQLREPLSRFINKPHGWTYEPASEDEEQTAIDHIRQAVDVALHDVAVQRLIENHLSDWRLAYDEFRGPGSTRRRADTIFHIYETAAPLPDTVMTEGSTTFVREIRQIVTSAIQQNGGEVRLTEAA